MQCGGVAVTDQQLGIGTDRRPVEQRQDSRTAPASTHREDRADFRVGEHGVEIGCAVGIGSREIAVPVLGVRAQPRNQPHAPDPVQRPVTLFG